ncbi:Epoxyqueuosine (oQ) reductase QueG [Geitlerinema sp. FC II]|nr:Epoxyqueuosine (oQ) reductase QueG [Geitlerinema sp. FC II]
MFQSLKGILVNFNNQYGKLVRVSACVSIPQRDFGEFQRKFARRLQKAKRLFQSLKGILVNFNTGESSLILPCLLVSIPQRDFGEFQLQAHSCRKRS